MSSTGTKPSAPCSREQIREAAVWLALLRGPDRTERLERGFRRWLAASPGHAAAFETISTAWEESGALPRGPLPHLSRWQRAGFRQGFLQAAIALTSVAAVAVLTLLFYHRDAGVTTDVGEQRMVALDDGTRVFLNTDTRLIVNYDEHQRAVELRSGEAFFEVAKRDATWPFVVTAGKRTIKALGTAFVVRHDERLLTVTLVEGKVAVSTDDPVDSGGGGAPITLVPGQRVTFARESPATVDAPALEKVTAWRSGHVDLADVTLAEAAAEMNRYSHVKLFIEHPQAAAIPITGVFRAGDTASFASAVAESYGLTVVASPDRLTLTGKPGAAQSR